MLVPILATIILGGASVPADNPSSPWVDLDAVLLPGGLIDWQSLPGNDFTYNELINERPMLPLRTPSGSLEYNFDLTGRLPECAHWGSIEPANEPARAQLAEYVADVDAFAYGVVEEVKRGFLAGFPSTLVLVRIEHFVGSDVGVQEGSRYWFPFPVLFVDARPVPICAFTQSFRLPPQLGDELAVAIFGSAPRSDALNGVPLFVFDLSRILSHRASDGRIQAAASHSISESPSALISLIESLK